MNLTDTAQYFPFCMPDSADQAVTSHAVQPVFSLDTILSSLERPECVEVPSPFEGHALQVSGFGAQQRSGAPAPSWAFLVIILAIVSTWLYHRYHGLTFSVVVQSAFDYRAMDRNLRENNLNHLSSLAPVAMLWGSAMALLVMHLSYRFGVHAFSPIDAWQSIVTFLVLLLGISTFCHFRNSLFRFIGHTYEQGDSTESYIASNYLFMLIETMVALPLLLVLYYGGTASHWAFILVFGVVGIIFLVRVVRGVNLFLTLSTASRLHLFYYICIVEFGPLLVLLKVINIL